MSTLLGVLGFALFGFVVLVVTFCAVGGVNVAFGRANAVAAPVCITLLAIGLALALWVFARFVSQRDLQIGSDGVTLRGTLRRRFVPFSSIRAIDAHPLGAVLKIRGRMPLALPLAIRGERATAAFRQRLVSAWEASVRKADALPWLALLDRGDRSRGEWKRDLDDFAKREGGYRQQRFDPEDLVRVAESAATPPRRRIAAAIAARGAAGPAQIERLRIAATACVDEDLQRALDAAVSEGEILEAELERAARRRL